MLSSRHILTFMLLIGFSTVVEPKLSGGKLAGVIVGSIFGGWLCIYLCPALLTGVFAPISVGAAKRDLHQADVDVALKLATYLAQHDQDNTLHEIQGGKNLTEQANSYLVAYEGVALHYMVLPEHPNLNQTEHAKLLSGQISPSVSDIKDLKAKYFSGYPDPTMTTAQEIVDLDQRISAAMTELTHMTHGFPETNISTVSIHLSKEEMEQIKVPEMEAAEETMVKLQLGQAMITY